ncbi:MAG: response regulator [Catalinimonas sp.]
MSAPRKVLIGEDSSVIQNLTKKILKFQNYAIDSAKNGKQVLDKIENQTYDVLLLDINMPIMDGMECARRIRALDDPIKANMPIVAITGNARNYSEEDFAAAGINDYLLKPLDFDRLVEVVNRAVVQE